MTKEKIWELRVNWSDDDHKVSARISSQDGEMVELTLAFDEIKDKDVADAICEEFRKYIFEHKIVEDVKPLDGMTAVWRK